MNPLIRKAVQRMRPYTPGEQPAGPGFIKLNTNENPYPPSPAVRACVRAMDPAGLRRYPDPSCRALREVIGALHGWDPGQIIVGNGSDELLMLCVRAFVDEGGRVGYFDPSYSLYPVLAESAGLAVRPTPLGRDFSWHPPRTAGVRLFFLACPNAPTGLVYPERELAAFCRRFRGVVVVDEAYVDFAERNALALARRLSNVLVLRTLSKSYALAGLRLGYLLGPEPLVRALYTIKDSYNVGRLAQDIGRAALRDQKTLRARVRRIVATRGRTAAALAERGYTVYPSQANFLWVRPPRGAAAEGVYRSLRAMRILVRHFPGARTGAYLRITIGTDAEMKALLRALDAIHAQGG